MNWRVYIRKGLVYVPTTVKAEAGYYMHVEPIEVVPAWDFDAVQRAIWQTIRKGNATVPTLMRDEFPEPEIFKYAKVKSWAEFERSTLTWSIEERDGKFCIAPGRKLPQGGWEDDPARIEALPPGTSIEDVASRVAFLVRASKNEEKGHFEL